MALIVEKTRMPRFNREADISSVGAIYRSASNPSLELASENRMSADQQVMIVSLGYALLAVLAWFVDSQTENGKPMLSAIVSGMFAVHIFTIRKSIADPVVIFAVTMFFYSFLPLVADTGYVTETLGFDLSEAYSLYNAGQLATMLAVPLAIYLIPQREQPDALSEQWARKTSETSLACVAGGLIAGVLGIALISAYIASKGFVLGGNVNYGESFTEHLEAGSGVYLLCIPLAISSIALLMVSRHPASKVFLLIPIFCFLEILVGIGQRKYFLEPTMFLVAFYWRARHAYQILFVVAGAAAAFILFCFLGYLRINGLEIRNILNLSVWSDFITYISVYIGSETVLLYATSSAAVTRVIEPLPYFGDYINAWIFAIPHFFLSANSGATGTLYQSANDRFINAYSPAEAVEGTGYGFSFLGEAYLVGGLPMIFLVVTLQVIGFRYLYVRGGGERQVGLLGALSIVSIYFAIWTQRNAFAYTLKEFVIDGTSIIFTLYVAGRSLSILILPLLDRVRSEKTVRQNAVS